MKFNIATGRSRSDQRWQNKQVTWDQFIEKIKATHRTVETVEEYFAFKKERQDEVKDVGGFVGGYLSGGRRLATAVTTRSILTFDADKATPDFWDKFCLQYNCTAAIYSTHKHTTAEPRYRLLIPLSREVFVDEYVAIMRRIAQMVGIDQFDHTGYQPHRLMYWPSTSKDGAYDFREQKGPLLSPDEVLSTYINWQDVSEWPMGQSETKVLSHEAKRQGEPHDKPGLIGAFNRAYPISSAIEFFLSEVYEPCDVGEGRYTYKEGTTAAGVITYDDKFVYSHHSTDPVSNILCNAFDLVRIHKFGLLDTEGADTPVNKRPSYLAMSDFVSNDSLVKQQIGEAKMANAKDVFANVMVEGAEVDLTWLKQMDVDRKGNYLLTIHNIALILEHDPVFKDNIAYDEFEQQPIFKRSLPWRTVGQALVTGEGRIGGMNAINDNDLANIENYIEKVYKLSAGAKLQKGLLVVFEKFRFHPVVSYLKSLTWDGVSRLDSMIIDYLGAEDSLYTRTVTRKAFVACVARVFNPGVKYDTILTFLGEEGQGKSMLIDKMGGKWFSDSFNLHMLKSKEAYEQIQGVWLVEIGELSGMMKTEVETVKSFVAARKDRYRSPYARTTEDRPRQSVFFATSNIMQPLKSQSGNRRFWPVATHVNKPSRSVFTLEQEMIDQLWAEAVMYFRKKETLYLPKDIEEIAKNIQESYTEEDAYTETFRAFLSYKLPENWYNMTRWDKIDYINNYDEATADIKDRTKVCKYELWEVALGKRETMETNDLRKITLAMSKLKHWVKENDYVRFGTSYPRHRGSYKRVFSLAEVLM